MLKKIGTFNDSAREAWLEKSLKEIPAGSRLLDAGAGELKYKRFCSHLKYVSQDFAQYDGVGDSKGLQVGSWDQTRLDIVSDITAIPEPDGSFDAIMCIEVFEHLPNPLLALQEFSRLLRPGGHLILTVPFWSLTHLAPYHFSTGFNRYFFETHLPTYDFELVELNQNGNYFESIAQEIRRLPSIASRYAGKNCGLFSKGILAICLLMLGRFSRLDTGSGELLCYGWNMRAIRK